jgi:hypothetical protein
MRYYPAVLLAIPTILLTACDGGPIAPAGPDAIGVMPVSGAFLLEPSGGVEMHAEVRVLLDDAFSFLDPLPPGEASGLFDPSVLSELSVEVCEPDACDATVWWTYTADAGPGAETIRIDPEAEHFIVNWRPSDLNLPSPASYRLRVAVAGLPLGDADVYLVSTGGDLQHADTGESLALQDKRTLPVKFSVRRNPVILAWLAAAEGATAAEVAEALTGEFASDAGEVAILLAFLDYSAVDVAGVLADLFDMSAEEVLGLLMTTGLLEGAEGAAGALLGGGFPVAEVVQALQDVFALSVEEIAGLLHDAGAEAFDVGAALFAEVGEDLEALAKLLGGAGFGAESVFEAIYRTGTEVLSNPVDFALDVALAVMHGTGYALDDFKDALFGGIHDWTQEQLVDGLGLSGYSMGELVPFMLDVLGLTVDVLMDRAAKWGKPLDEVVEALMDADAAIEEIVAGAVAAFDATAEAVAKALADAGATALEIAESLVVAFEQGLDEVATTLKALGYDAEPVFEAIYRTSTKVLSNPVDFSLNLALAVMHGTGYTLNSFKEALFGGIHDWTEEQLIDGLSLSGFGMKDLAEFMFDVMGLTAEAIASRAEGWGIPVGELVDALFEVGVAAGDVVASVVDAYDLTVAELAAAMKAAGRGVEEFADAMVEVFGITVEAAVDALKDAGYLASDVGDWLFDRFAHLGEAGFEMAARILDKAGYAFQHVAGWVWTRSGAAIDLTARILNKVGFSAGQAAGFLVNTAGNTARMTFSALKKAGYAAAVVAAALHTEAGSSIVALGGWLLEFYELSAAATLEILYGLGASLVDLASVALDVYGSTIEQATELLLALGFDLVDIVAALGG